MMKKVIGILFIIGMILILADVDNMMIFFATKVIGIIMMIPTYLIFRNEE